MLHRNLTRLWQVTTLLLAVSGAAHATTVQEQIHSQASDYLSALYQQQYPNARAEIRLSPVSSRSGLSNCTQPITFKSSNRLGSRISIRASCSAPPWAIYLTARVKLFKTILTAAQPITKGQIIQAQHLRLIEKDVAALRNNYLTEPASVVGMAARHNLRPGQVLKASQLTAAIVIRKGDAVTIEARRGPLSIRTAGIALEDGKAGEQIRVRNEKSGSELKAFAVSPGLVRTP